MPEEEVNLQTPCGRPYLEAGLIRIDGDTNRAMSGNAGGLNGPTQHSAQAPYSLKTKEAKSAG